MLDFQVHDKERKAEKASTAVVNGMTAFGKSDGMTASGNTNGMAASRNSNGMTALGNANSISALPEVEGSKKTLSTVSHDSYSVAARKTDVIIVENINKDVITTSPTDVAKDKTNFVRTFKGETALPKDLQAAGHCSTADRDLTASSSFLINGYLNPTSHGAAKNITASQCIIASTMSTLTDIDNSMSAENEIETFEEASNDSMQRKHSMNDNDVSNEVLAADGGLFLDRTSSSSMKLPSSTWALPIPRPSKRNLRLSEPEPKGPEPVHGATPSLPHGALRHCHEDSVQSSAVRVWRMMDLTP